MKDGVSRFAVVGNGKFSDGLVDLCRAEIEALALTLLLNVRSEPLGGVPLDWCKLALGWVGDADEVDIGVPTELAETNEVADAMAVSFMFDQSSTPDLKGTDGKMGSFDDCLCICRPNPTERGLNGNLGESVAEGLDEAACLRLSAFEKLHFLEGVLAAVKSAECCSEPVFSGRTGLS